MTSANDDCTFRADMIVKTPGGGYTRIADVKCMRPAGHDKATGEDRDHEFFAADTLTYGASREKGRWVTRR